MLFKTLVLPLVIILLIPGLGTLNTDPRDPQEEERSYRMVLYNLPPVTLV